MLRRDLENIPEYQLPAGFSFCWFRPGDEETWVQIQTAADLYNKISRQLFDQEFADRALLPERQFYVMEPLGRTIGTAAAWFKEIAGERIGRVHWVAVVPEFQKRGLGKAMMSFCCRRLKELGHRQAFLSTSSVRIPAIKLYLQFGFEPCTKSDQEEALWKQIRAQLSH